MASHRRLFLWLLLVLSVVCSGCIAASRRFLSLSLHDLIGTHTQIDCPPMSPGINATEGNKLPIVRPGMRWLAGDASRLTQRDVLARDSARLSSLFEQSTPTSAQPPAASFPPVSSSPAPAPAVTIPDRPGLSLGTLEFVVVVGFGTPTRPFTVDFDTGSDLSWIQCLPCSDKCYRQHDQLFDPSKSSSYAPISCGSPMCSAAGGQCNGTTCLYSVRYGDGSSTSGILAQETLTLTASRMLPNFSFGCGQQNDGMFGGVDGLLGLGRSAISLPSQAAPVLGSAFSYCLPSYNDSVGYLTIGAKPVSGKVQYTRMIQKPEQPIFYFIELVSIDIGGYILPVPPTVFTSTGTIIDSGTILTYLPAVAYAALRDRFKFTMQQYKPAPPVSILDTCYNFTGESVIVIPAVSFKFSDGAVFDLNFFGIVFFPEPTIGCLAFTARPATAPFSIIGNIQQRSAEVVYDIAGGRIGFLPASC